MASDRGLSSGTSKAGKPSGRSGSNGGSPQPAARVSSGENSAAKRILTTTSLRGEHRLVRALADAGAVGEGQAELLEHGGAVVGLHGHAHAAGRRLGGVHGDVHGGEERAEVDAERVHLGVEALQHDGRPVRPAAHLGRSGCGPVGHAGGRAHVHVPAGLDLAGDDGIDADELVAALPGPEHALGVERRGGGRTVEVVVHEGHADVEAEGVVGAGGQAALDAVVQVGVAGVAARGGAVLGVEQDEVLELPLAVLDQLEIHPLTVRIARLDRRQEQAAIAELGGGLAGAERVVDAACRLLGADSHVDGELDGDALGDCPRFFSVFQRHRHLLCPPAVPPVMLRVGRLQPSP